MPSVNLIPLELLLKRQKIRRIRLWLMIGGATWVLASVPVVRELSAAYQLSSQRAAVDIIAEQLENAHRRRRQSAERLKLLRQEVARAEKLRYKRLWTAMISVIAESIPEGVWLTRLSTDPPQPQVDPGARSPLSHRRTKGSDPQAVSDAGYDTLIGKAGPRRLLLEGRALGLEDIYAFVDALNALDIFENASIRAVRSDVSEGIKVTYFTMECEW